MPPVKHALLGASSAERWLACPPSARLTESMEDRETQYTVAGSLAHKIAELKVRKYFELPDDKGKIITETAFARRMNQFKKHELYVPDMDRVTDAYLDYIKDCCMGYAEAPHIAVEEKVDYSGYAPEGFGTADCIIIGSKTLRVIDFKNGTGVPVPVEKNPQLMLYAIGALSRYSMLYPIDTVIMTIAQLRLGEPQEWETTPEALFQWAAEYVAPRAKLAYAGEGEFQDGDHCRFCKVRATCRKRAESNLELTQKYQTSQNPELLTPEEIGAVLTRADPYKKWLSDIQEFALDATLSGEHIPGWKAVEGRSIRQFDDTDKAFADIIATGIDEVLLYERKPLTLTAVEKLLGKKDFAEKCGNHVIKPPGKPTLVQESDKRDPINSAAKDFADLQTQ